MRNALRCISLILLLVALSACNISGTITTEGGDPVAGITVTLTGPVSMETTTDSAGRYAFSDQKIAYGTFTVTPLSDSHAFEPEQRRVKIKGQNAEGVDFAAVVTSQDEPVVELKSEKPRDTTPNLSADDVASLVNGNTDFALALYQQLLSGTPDNIFYSPYSISTALAMLYGGAAGDTARQIADCLNFTLPDETIHSGFNYLALELASRGDGAAGTDGGQFRLNVANALWLQENLDVQQTFLDLLAVNYGAGTNLLDFITAPEPSRLVVNQWVAEQTENRIPNLLPQGTINTDTRFVLTNAVYFNAAWAKPFPQGATLNEPFYRIDQSTLSVPMMHITNYFRYAAVDSYKAVELPYDGFELSMVIIVPDSGQFTAVEAALDSAGVTTLLEKMESTRVKLGLPQWEYKSKFSLKDTLSAMGMIDAFDPMSADFSGISDSIDLYISHVVHEAFVKVNEKGTEAAAATGIVGGTTSAPIDQPVVLTIDRPFIYFIRDIATQSILFVGRVVNPDE